MGYLLFRTVMLRFYMKQVLYFCTIFFKNCITFYYVNNTFSIILIILFVFILSLYSITERLCNKQFAGSVLIEITLKTRKCVYETLCPQLVSHFQDVKMSEK